MLEIFAIPYLLATGCIAWAIFEPFFRIHESQPLSRSRLAISDLLAISFPISMMLALARWLTPWSNLSLFLKLLGLAVALLFAAVTLLAALYLVPKTFPVTFLERVAVVGVIAPLGIVLTVGWVGLLTWVCYYSIMYLAPAMMFVAALTFGLRMLTLRVCRIEFDLFR